VNSALVGNAVGVTLAVTGIGAVAAATYAGITSYNLDKQFTQQETKIETKVEKFIQAEKEVLKAQADSVKAQGDSVKTQAWGAHIGTIAVSGVAFVVSTAALAVALRK
jgi:nucleoside phosphorylase